MRIAVISDIHGNIAALEAVLADIGRQHVDNVVNLGDLVSGGLHPRETAKLLVASDFPTIAGNHERHVLTHSPADMSRSDRHAHEQITDDQRRWLDSLPPTLDLGSGVLAVHGTPASDLQYFLDTVEEGGARPATAEEIGSRAAGFEDRALILCGHTHLQRSATLASGTLVVNPGSVGQPAYDDDHPYPHVMESGSPHARYAVVDDHGRGDWTVKFERIEYDHTAAASDAGANGRPDIAAALLTGFAR